MTEEEKIMSNNLQLMIKKVWVEADRKFDKYGLFAYSEGSLTEKARQMAFNGIPVLFIPGNAGSYKQVRSIASIALRKSLNSRPGFHFDYFTIDTNDEFSGLNGALLFEQLEYVNKSVQRILQLYANNRDERSKSIILIGHSMGGIIARHFLTTLPPNSTLVPLVLTFATPHTRPPIIIDKYMYDFYKNIDNFTSENTVLVSISGGRNDFLIPTFSTNFGDVHAVSTTSPRVWASADHLCILWCKQLLLAINRALFESVDVKTKQISTDLNRLKTTFNHHLVRNSGTKVNLAQRYTSPIHFDNRGDWVESLPRQYTLKLAGLKQTQWQMIRLVNQLHHEFLTVVMLNLEAVEWAFACPAIHIRGQSRICEDGIHLTQLGEIAPSIKYKRRMLNINLKNLKKQNPNVTHVVIRVPPSDETVFMQVDVHNLAERKINVDLPRWFSFKRHTIIERTVENSIRYNLELPKLQQIWQFYQLVVEPACKLPVHHATMSLVVPWGNQNYHSYITESKVEPMDVRLYTSKPSDDNSVAKIQLTLDPSCRYRISIESSILGTFSQLARYYTPLLIGNIAVVILMSFRSQVASIGTNGRCSLFFKAIKDGTKPYYILTVVKLLSRFLSVGNQNKPFLVPDWKLLESEGTDFFWLPLLVYMCSVGIVWIIALIISVSLLVCESTLHKMMLKLFAKAIMGTATWSDWILNGLHKVPSLVAVILITLSWTTCGGLALCLGCVFYFLKLTQLSQEFIESLVWKFIRGIGAKFGIKPKRKPKEGESSNDSISSNGLNDSNEGGKEQNSNETANAESNDNKEKVHPEMEGRNWLKDLFENSEFFFHFTIFLLWSVVAALNVPSVLTWAKNFKYSESLDPDPSFHSGFILSLCALPLWQLKLPDVQKMYYKELSHAIYFLAVVSLMFASINVYRLNYTVTITIAIVILHQLLAPTKESTEVSEGTVIADVEKKYDEIKAKIE